MKVPVLDSSLLLPMLHAEVLACRRCEDAGYLESALPVAGGPHTARVMVIGQAPGVRTMLARRHFAGPGGKLLREWIARGGIPHERQSGEVYFTSLTRCFPGPAPRSGSGDRKPSPTEAALCAPFLWREMELLDPRLVLLVGSMAIERFLGKVKLGEVVGTLVERENRYWLPLPHPSGVSRWLNDPQHRALVEQGLGKMQRLVDAGISAPATASAVS